MERTDLVAQAVRLALAAGMAGVISISPAYAQDEADELAIQNKITVTGSRIKRADIEGPQPITILTREEIDASGELSVAELLRAQTFNTFGSFKQRSGDSRGSVNTVSMRGLGPWYTLVLVNGRRVASAPSFSSSVQNLSMIPLAAVERIEVLRDGASAIYGTDAMAGVINVILRRDYTGMNLAYDIGRPEQSGGDEDSYSLTGGVSGAKGNVTFGMEVQQKEIVFNRDQEYTQEGLSILGFPGFYFAYLETGDPRNPLDHFLSVGDFADPRCPAELGSDPDFPWSEETPSPWVEGGTICRYAYWGESATEAENDTKSFFVDTTYELTDNAQFFARGIFSYHDVFGRYAPSPAFLEMSQSVPQNPTNPANSSNYRGDPFGGQSIDVDTDGDGVPDTTVDGPFDLSLAYRNVPGGNRDGHFDDTMLDYVAGIRGTTDWLGGMDWELAAQWGEQNSDGKFQGQAILPNLQAEIDSGNFDVFGVFGPYDDDERTAAQRASATSSYSARHRITGGDGQVSFDAFQLDNGPVAVALGFEYRDEYFEYGEDEQTAAGNIGGGNTGVPRFDGARVIKSLFAETLIPVFSTLDANLAVRVDDYNDFGTTVNPKVSIGFRPLDTLLLRSSYGQGFRAPEFELLYHGPWPTGGDGVDSWRCSQTEEDTDGDGRSEVPEDDLPPWHPCVGQYWEGAQIGNPDLEPETSDNWTAGFAWSPTNDLSLIADYYDITIDDQISGADPQDVFDEELRLRQAGASGPNVGDVTRNQRGWIEWFYFDYINKEKVETSGVDAEIAYSFSLGGVGDFSSTLRWTHVIEYVEPDGFGGTNDIAGEPGQPQDRGQLTLNWNRGDFAATLVGNYIGEQDMQDGEYKEWMDSFTTWDLQFSYSTPWNGQVTLGARNAFDQDPPQFENNEGENWDYDITQHEAYGRVPYLRLEQDF
jgi:iron complex outermembrane receptor protein